MRNFLLLLCLIAVSFSTFPQDITQTFLSLSNTGVNEFLLEHPDYDGRGTIIFVFDTGVDMGIDGLKHTLTGEVKVIDVQDFTGEGDVLLYEADIDEEYNRSFFINEEMNFKVFGANELTYHSIDNKYYMGAFEEKALINSSSKSADLNGNGTQSDKYMIVSFKTMKEEDQSWIAYIDTDGDGDISDEFPLHNYKDYQESFTFKNENELPPLTMGINIFPDEMKISVHFDDGAHGTHVAGIASGNNIGGIGLNGVAPGAHIISCKLGNNLYSGGATVTESMKKAFLYADKISRETESPCIVNMSFGIGSEIEGRSEMEKFIANLVKDNPYLYICTSNGNEGPGLSSTGLPSSSEFVLSSGAVLPKETGRDLYSSNLGRDIVLHFSSRGGEVNKPDVCAPGACTSTVPNWSKKDRFWGTSMASPYSAGIVSLLMSAMRIEYPDVKIPSQLVFTAIRESATRMEGYSYLDQGSGYINVASAYKLLKNYVDHNEMKKIETYSFTSIAPNMPDGSARNLYIRNGSFLNGDEEFSFTVRRNNFQMVDKFYRVYRIECNEEWLIPVKNKTYIRNDQPATISVKFNKSKMKAPGLYSGKIKAYRNDDSNFPEFEMLVTVIIPYTFSIENNYQMKWDNREIKPGDNDRYFINIPAGQTSMKISLSRNSNNYSRIRYSLDNPDGIEEDYSPILYSVDNETELEKYYYNLQPGVYELDVIGYYTAERTSTYNLSVKFNGINRLDNQPLNEGNNTIGFINSSSNVDKYFLSGEITGYRRIKNVKLEGKNHFYLSFNLNPSEYSKTFTIDMAKTDYNKLTDFALMILDKDGIVVTRDALSYRNGSITVENLGTDQEEYTLELVPAFCHANGEMTMTLTEDTEFDAQEVFNVSYAGMNSVKLYPNTKVELQCDIEEINNNIPEDGKLYGIINFVSAASNEVVNKFSVILNPD